MCATVRRLTGVYLGIKKEPRMSLLNILLGFFFFLQLFKTVQAILISLAMQNQASSWIWPRGHNFLFPGISNRSTSIKYLGWVWPSGWVAKKKGVVSTCKVWYEHLMCISLFSPRSNIMRQVLYGSAITKLKKETIPIPPSPHWPSVWILVPISLLPAV